MHKLFIKYNFFSIHDETVRSIKYMAVNQMIISCSGQTQNSVVITDPERIKKEYSFSLNKVRS